MIDFVRSSKAHIFLDDLLDSIVVGGDLHHHLSRVLRVKKGDSISAASRGKVREYKVNQIDKSQIQLQATSEKMELQENECVLAVSLIKLDRLEWGIAKAVELGATKIIIGATSRSSVKLNGKTQNKIESRLAAIVLNSAMQSRRSCITEIELVEDLFGFLREIDLDVVVCEPSGSAQVDVRGKVVVVGPEGGFEKSELQRLDPAPELWCLAPTVLRAETAIAFAVGLSSRSFLV